MSIPEQQNEPHNRLMKARRVAGYRSARAAALALEAKPATYSAHENGTRKFSIADAKRYATLYDVSPGWLLTGEYFEGDPGARVSDTSLSAPVRSSQPRADQPPPAENSGPSERDILDFGKRALDLLKHIAPAAEESTPGSGVTIGEVVINKMLDDDYDPELEQWEIVGQWQFPPSYLSEVLKVTPVDLAVMVIVDDNMAPTFEAGDRVIVDFEQKKVTVDGVYIVQDLDRNLHLQRVMLAGTKLTLSNDNPDRETKHIERTVNEADMDIVGKICGIIAAR